MTKVRLTLYPQAGFAMARIEGYIDLRDYVKRIPWLSWERAAAGKAPMQIKISGPVGDPAAAQAAHLEYAEVFAQRIRQLGAEVWVRNEEKDDWQELAFPSRSEEELQAIETGHIAPRAAATLTPAPKVDRPTIVGGPNLIEAQARGTDAQVKPNEKAPLTEAEKAKLIERIRKLLRVAGNNPSAQEARSARAKAYQLMNDNDIDESIFADIHQPHTNNYQGAASGGQSESAGQSYSSYYSSGNKVSKLNPLLRILSGVLAVFKTVLIRSLNYATAFVMHFAPSAVAAFMLYVIAVYFFKLAWNWNLLLGWMVFFIVLCNFFLILWVSLFVLFLYAVYAIIMK